MEKTFQPANIETRWYQEWEARGYFAPQGGDEAYSIMIPPPNVTGSLHINGEKREEGTSAEVLGNPLTAVAWLANKLAEWLDSGLRAWDIFWLLPTFNKFHIWRELNNFS